MMTNDIHMRNKLINYTVYDTLRSSRVQLCSQRPVLHVLALLGQALDLVLGICSACIQLRLQL